MSSIVYQIDKKTGAKYAFESISYWDKDKKQPRSKRKYLGKVDPETGVIIPSRGRSVHREESTAHEKDTLPALHKEIEIRDDRIKMLSRNLDEFLNFAMFLLKIKTLVLKGIFQAIYLFALAYLLFNWYNLLINIKGDYAI